eukprot:COSAG01_NODE_2860_length_6960_cov_3.226094_9_plen_95_part_00
MVARPRFLQYAERVRGWHAEAKLVICAELCSAQHVCTYLLVCVPGTVFNQGCFGCNRCCDVVYYASAYYLQPYTCSRTVSCNKTLAADFRRCQV